MHCVVCWDAGCQSSCFNTFFTNPICTGFYLKNIFMFVNIVDICTPQVCYAACNVQRIRCGREQHYCGNGQLIRKKNLMQNPYMSTHETGSNYNISDSKGLHACTKLRVFLGNVYIITQSPKLKWALSYCRVHAGQWS